MPGQLQGSALWPGPKQPGLSIVGLQHSGFVTEGWRRLDGRLGLHNCKLEARDLSSARAGGLGQGRCLVQCAGSKAR